MKTDWPFMNKMVP